MLNPFLNIAIIGLWWVFIHFLIFVNLISTICVTVVEDRYFHSCVICCLAVVLLCVIECLFFVFVFYSPLLVQKEKWMHRNLGTGEGYQILVRLSLLYVRLKLSLSVCKTCNNERKTHLETKCCQSSLKLPSVYRSHTIMFTIVEGSPLSSVFKALVY